METGRRLFPEYCQTASLCKMYDLSPSGLHYLEDMGLIDPMREPGSGYRVYSMTELTRLFLHKNWRQYGFSAGESIDLILRNDPGEQEEAMRRREEAIAALPFTSASMRLTREADGHLREISLGFVCSPEDAKALGIAESAYVQRLPAKRCLVAFLCFKDDLLDLEQHLTPLYRQIAALGFQPDGPAVTSLITMTDMGDGPERVDRIYIPVQGRE